MEISHVLSESAHLFINSLAFHSRHSSNHRTHQIFLFALVDVSCLSRALGEIMGFRFRKIIPLGKGFRLNFSKRGVSSSIGKPGATLNIGKNGIRPTVGIPGTGMSFTPSKTSSTKTSDVQLGVIISAAIWILICIVVLCLGLFLTLTNGGNPPTPTLTSRSIPIDEAISLTANAAQTQTQMAASPTLASQYTPTFTPTVTMAVNPTATTFISIIQTNAASNPTEIIYPTNTPLSLATQPINQEAVCSCAGNLYNCPDFQTHSAAQACYNYCVSLGLGDIHKLDGNNKNGLACESLP